ncbi:hypothetical protein EK904_012742 [Melospiza melodia maxima]|nr:hypothetical protein EK904_012742 [Melospiza melodia maxima]
MNTRVCNDTEAHSFITDPSFSENDLVGRSRWNRKQLERSKCSTSLEKYTLRGEKPQFSHESFCYCCACECHTFWLAFWCPFVFVLVCLHPASFLVSQRSPRLLSHDHVPMSIEQRACQLAALLESRRALRHQLSPCLVSDPFCSSKQDINNESVVFGLWEHASLNCGFFGCSLFSVIFSSAWQTAECFFGKHHLHKIEKEERLRTQSRGKHKVGRAERKKETDVGTLQAMMDYDEGFQRRTKKILRKRRLSKPETEPSRRFFVDQWELSRSLRSSNRPSSPSSDSLRQKYIKMYTGGVSSLAEQIANQLQRKEQPKTLLDKKELGSLKKEFPQNLGGSDVCYFCRKRVYVMERLSAEGKFFHRSCFKCEYCATTLRLSSYAYDIEDGKFYCKPHYCYRVSGYAQRKRPAVGPLSGKDTKGPVQDAMASDGSGRASSLPSSAERAPGSSASFFGRVVQFSLGLVGRVRVLSQRLHSKVSSIGHHVAQNPLDSFFMCQLLAFGVPFLYVQSEVLGQILGEFCGQPADQTFLKEYQENTDAQLRVSSESAQIKSPLMGLGSLNPLNFVVLAGHGALPSASICAAPGRGCASGVVNSSGCRAQSVISRLRSVQHSAGVTLCVRGLHRACVASALLLPGEVMAKLEPFSGESMESEKLKSSYGCALMVFREKYSEQSPSQQTLKQVLLYIASNIHEEVVLLTWRAGKEWLFPLNGMSLKDLGGFGIKERRMLKDWQFEAQKIWKGKDVVGRVGDAADLMEFHCKILKNVLRTEKDVQNNSVLSLYSWLDPAKNTLSWELLGSQLLLSHSLAFRPVDLCHWNICCLYVYILKGDMSFSGHFKSFIECFCLRKIVLSLCERVGFLF